MESRPPFGVATRRIGVEFRADQIEALARLGTYPSGTFLPALSRGFAAFERGDYSAAIDALAQSPLKVNALAAAARNTT